MRAKSKSKNKNNKHQVKLLTKAEFDRLSPSKRRVMIAQDVIQQLDIEQYTAKSSVYISGRLNNGGKFDPQDGINPKVSPSNVSTDPVHDLLVGGQVADGCHVCAAGAGCLSAIRLFDKAKYNKADYSDQLELDLDNTFHKYFPQEMRERLEGWFERSAGDDFWQGLDDDTRLRAIYQNVIDTNGNFAGMDCDKYHDYGYDDAKKLAKANEWWLPYAPADVAKMVAKKQAARDIAVKELAQAKTKRDKVEKQLAKIRRQEAELSTQESELTDLVSDLEYDLQEA